jgi:chromosome partitioning protein
MTVKSVAVVNLKGGVGKTTLTVALAEGSAVTGHRTLVVDLDPQANSSSIVVGGDVAPNEMPWRKDMTFASFIRDRLARKTDDIDLYTTKDLISFTDGETVSLLSGAPQMRRLERQLLGRSGATLAITAAQMDAAIESVLARAHETYDLVLFDCPPGLSLLTEAALRQCDLILLPTSPSPMGIEGLTEFAKYLREDLQISGLPDKLFAFLSMMTNTRLAESYASLVRSQPHLLNPLFNVFETEFRLRVAFQEAMQRDQPVQLLQQRWGAEADAVLAATAELWSYLRRTV